MDSCYFAYGSNLDPERKENRTGGIREARRARLSGFRFAFNKKGDDGSGKANIVADEWAETWGVAYLCSPEALETLDRMEGVPNHYWRQSGQVVLETGETIDAITYVAHPDKVSERLRPSAEYLQHVLRGIRYHQLPEPHRATIEDLG